MTPETAAKVLREQEKHLRKLADDAIDHESRTYTDQSRDYDRQADIPALGASALEALAWMEERKVTVEWFDHMGRWEASWNGGYGTGPTPLAAIQDAMGMEKGNG